MRLFAPGVGNGRRRKVASRSHCACAAGKNSRERLSGRKSPEFAEVGGVLASARYRPSRRRESLGPLSFCKSSSPLRVTDCNSAQWRRLRVSGRRPPQGLRGLLTRHRLAIGARERLFLGLPLTPILGR